jgi:tetratricopeptide (TPR) repeat protein
VGDFLDINKSMELLKEAYEMSPNEFLILHGLGESLGSCFGRLGDLGDLSEAISMYRNALAAFPFGGDTANRATCLCSLSSVLAARFNCLGNLGDINESVQAAREAVELVPTPADDISKLQKMNILANFGICLQRRFEHLGDLSDINQSVAVLTEAVGLSLTAEVKSLILPLLSECLQSRFARLGELDDLTKSVAVAKEAVKLCPNDHPRRSACLSYLGGALRMRFERLDSLSDLNEAIVAFKEGTGLLTDDNPEKIRLLGYLGEVLYLRFLRSNNFSDLNDGISAMDSAVRSLPDRHPMRTGLLFSLSIATWTRRRELGDHIDCEQAIALAASAACSKTGPTTIRFKAAMKWAHMLKHRTAVKLFVGPRISPLLGFVGPKVATELEVQQHLDFLLSGSPESVDRLSCETGTETMPAYGEALRLLSELSWIGLSIRDRHRHMGKNADRIIEFMPSEEISTSEYAMIRSMPRFWTTTIQRVEWSGMPLAQLSELASMPRRWSGLNRVVPSSGVKYWSFVLQWMPSSKAIPILLKDLSYFLGS